MDSLRVADKPGLGDFARRFAVSQDLEKLALRPKIGKSDLSGFVRVCYESKVPDCECERDISIGIARTSAM